MQLHFAPIQGFTDTIYLSEYARHYDAPDACYTPFIRLEKGAPRRQDMARLSYPYPAIPSLTPQIIFRDADESTILTDAIKAAGYSRIDLNLGCPYPMQTRKGRGAAMIANTAAMREVCDLIRKDSDTSYSVKMRLGMKSPDEWRLLMPLLNNTPLRHITLHPRTAAQMYAGDLDYDQTTAFVSECRHLVIFNGEARTPADIDRILTMFPTLDGVMIGRGLIARPSLAMEWREGAEWPAEERLRRQIAFFNTLKHAYAMRLCGDAQLLQKMKPYWEYLEPEIGRKAAKAIAKATTMAQYEKAVASLTS